MISNYALLDKKRDLEKRRTKNVLNDIMMKLYQKTCTNVAYLERFWHVHSRRKREKKNTLRENDYCFNSINRFGCYFKNIRWFKL